MGKTGTGKSTLLNYLCDSNIAETGSGKPVTGEGIFEYSVNINGQEVRIFDSWGIEAGKVERWKNLIDQSLLDHGVQKRMEDWFHSVIYCVQAGGGRVEDIDSEIIRKFLTEGYLLTVVLTKADQVDESDETKMRNVILGELKGSIPSSCKGKLNVIATCAEKKKTRSGETKPFGKEEVQKAILDGWKETVIERMPKHVVARLCELVDEWREDEMAKLSNSKISGNENDNIGIYNSIYEDAKHFSDKIRKTLVQNILSEAIASCKKADSSLKAILDFEFDVIEDKKAKQLETKWWEWFFILPTVVVGTIPILISNAVKAHSARRIQEESQHIEDYIISIADDIKSNCVALEPKIAKELQKSL